MFLTSRCAILVLINENGIKITKNFYFLVPRPSPDIAFYVYHILGEEQFQEAKSLNYYGNSTWSKQPVISLKHNLCIFGTCQAHNCPLDEMLTFLAPDTEYYTRKQPLLKTIYEYLRPKTLSGDPFPIVTIKTFEDVKAAKLAFRDETLALSIDPSLRSPRGNRSYSDALIGCSLTDGSMQFGVRSNPWDSASFITDEHTGLVIQSTLLDADLSGGCHLLGNVPLSDGSYADYAVGFGKGTWLVVADISGLNPAIEWTHENLQQKGVVPDLIYTGPDGILGRANFCSANTSGSYVVSAQANRSVTGSSLIFDPAYQDNASRGREIHVTQDGGQYLVGEAFASAVDISKKAIVWEKSLGDGGNPESSILNGVFYCQDAFGQMFGLDVENGQEVWRANGPSFGANGGIQCPQFAGGDMIWITPYAIPGNPPRSLGTRGVIFRLDRQNLLCDKETIRGLTSQKAFTSSRSTPKRYSSTDGVFGNLETVYSVTHSWSTNDGTVTGIHTVTGRGNATVIAKALNYINATKTMLLSTISSSGLAVKYLSARWLCKKTYILTYELKREDGSWERREATMNA